MSRSSAMVGKQQIDFSRSGVARYLQLATLFRRRIESGDWPAGSQIPTIDVLAVDYQVAKSTLRQALGLLEKDGLIERLRAKGTFVKATARERLWCEVATDWSGLLIAREGATIRVLASEPDRMPGVFFHDIGRPAASYRYLRRLHSRDGQPYHLGEVYIDAALCRTISPRALETKPSMQLLRDLPGLRIKEARQTLTVGSADPETAHYLQIPLNAPVAYVHRSVVAANGVLVFVGSGIYRGDNVRIDLKLK